MKKLLCRIERILTKIYKEIIKTQILILQHQNLETIFTKEVYLYKKLKVKLIHLKKKTQISNIKIWIRQEIWLGIRVWGN